MTKQPAITKRVVLVGHCNFDGPRLQRVLRSPSVDVVRVNDQAALDAACEQCADLLLINRVPVGFEAAGLDLIEDLRRRFPGQKMMLVSDFPDAQQQAVARGALPGFGKADMSSCKLTDVVRAAIGV